VSAAFAPSLGGLVASGARRPLRELWADPAELTRATLDTARRGGVSHVLFPFDLLVLAEAVGAPLRWPDDEPILSGARGVEIADLDPGHVVRQARTASAVAVTRFLSTSLTVAANLPAPGLLLEQLSLDPADEDRADAAGDLCVAFARVMLEAGASMLVVWPGPDGEPADLIPIRRLAEHYRARAVTAAPDSPEVTTVAVAAVVRGRGPDLRRDGLMVLTDRPLPADMDLAVLRRVAERIAAGGSQC